MSAPDELPDTMSFSPAPWRNLAMLAISLSFTALGAVLVADGKAGGWFPMLFFALGSLVLIASLMPGANRLLLDGDGFEVRSLFRAWRRRWADVSDFSVGQIAGQSMILFQEVQQQGTRLGRMNTALTGKTSGVPGVILGGKIHQACEMMIAFHARAENAR